VFGGIDVFGSEVHLSPLHRQYLCKEAFPVVGTLTKFAMYKNSRGPDPYVQNFMDEMDIPRFESWGLPRPNAEAAYMSLKKYDKVIPHMEEDQIRDLNLAWEWTERQFGIYMANSRVKDQAEVIAKLDKQTSPGAPFNVHYKTKKELFEEDPEIVEWLEADWERLASDPDWTSIWVNSLKEELRTGEKLRENSQRTFTAGSVDMTTHGNRLFADMNEKLYASHLRSASTVGWAPMYGNWHRLIKKLDVFPNGYALDESQYDSSLRAFLMWACARLRWRMLRPEDQTEKNYNRIRTLYRNIVNSLIVTQDGVLVLKLGGNPSGSINTISDNTLILYALKAYAWIRNYRKFNERLEPNYQEFEDNTAKALCGDDNTWTVSNWAHAFYNAYTIIEEWKKIGITTTTDSMEPRAADELDYLSAHTIYIKGVACPVYDREKLITSSLFCTKKLKSPAHTLTRVAGILVTGWTDIPFRLFARGLIDWLMHNYDHILCNDQDWIIAKCGVMSDAQLEELWTGNPSHMRFYPQSVSGPAVKSHMPDKSEMSSSKKQVKTQKRQQQRRARRATKRMPAKPRSRRANVGKVVTIVNQAPRTRQLKNGNRFISHREYLGKVVGSTDFSIKQFAMNPGVPSSFAWLWQQALAYESYRFRRVRYEFVNSKSGTFAGTVIMGIDYDPQDPMPLNEESLQTYWGAKTGQICEPLTLVADKAAMHKLGPTKFVRSGTTTDDLKLYDSGNFFIAISDCADTSNVGRVFCDYEVELMTPQVGVNTTNLSVRISPNGEQLSAPLGTSWVIVGSLPVQLITGFSFKVRAIGQYMIAWQVSGTGSPQVTISSVTGTSTFNVASGTNGGASDNYYAFQLIGVNSIDDIFTVTPAGTTISIVTIRIAPYTTNNG